MMKKVLMLSAVALAFSTVPAFADHHNGAEGEPGAHRGAGMFEKKDTNGDGVISKDEFLKAHEEWFNKMDTDGNGEISKEESKAGHEARREKMKEKRKERADKTEGSSEEKAVSEE